MPWSKSTVRMGGTVVYVFGSLIEGVVGMAFTMILVRLISTDDFGAWRQFMVLAEYRVECRGLRTATQLDVLLQHFGKGEEQGAIARRTMWLTLGVRRRWPW